MMFSVYQEIDDTREYCDIEVIDGEFSIEFDKNYPLYISRELRQNQKYETIFDDFSQYGFSFSNGVLWTSEYEDDFELQYYENESGDYELEIDLINFPYISISDSGVVPTNGEYYLLVKDSSYDSRLVAYEDGNFDGYSTINLLLPSDIDFNHIVMTENVGSYLSGYLLVPEV